jgi:hypothetical protein
MTLLESWMPKIPKTFQGLIVNSNYNFKKSRFKVFQKFCKMWKRLPFTKDSITSTHLGFHAMVINGQPKTQNPNEKKGAQK